MWLKAFQSEEKLLSESEFWILSIVKDDFEAPTEIMDRLYGQTNDWTPKPGTIYPILHRLADVGLLEKIEDGGLSFKRSEKGNIFLSSIAKPLRVQVIESINYYRQILNNLSLLQMLPVRYAQILNELSNEARNFSKHLKAQAITVQKRVEEESTSYEVPISFED